MITRHPTPTQTASLCRLLEKGYPLSTAARACGLPVSTVYRWHSLGREELQQIDDAAAMGKPPPDEEQFPVLGRFALEVERAKAVAHGVAIGVITDAAVDKLDWRAAAWLLERTAPDEFRERQQIDHGVAQGDDETAEAIAAKLIKAREAAESDGL